MQEDTGTAVRLPNGNHVVIHSEPQAWWKHNQHVAYVDPHLLAPDLDQPRQKMQATKLNELRVAIAADGVREPITVTLRRHAPWVRVAPEHEKMPFVIVSGHRRQRCALEAELPAVPIRIVIYPNETAHRDDATALNTNRDDMAPLDEARDIRRRLNLGEKPKSIGDSYGKTAVWVYLRNALNDLAPELQDLLAPDVPQNEQLPLGLATKLGSIKKPNQASVIAFCEEHGLDVPVHLPDDTEALSHVLQCCMYHIIRRDRMNATVAGDFIESARRQTNSGSRHTHKSPKYEPRKRREIMINFLNTVTQGVPPTWSMAELERIYNGRTAEEALADATLATQALAVLQKIRDELERIAESKPAVSDEVREILARPVPPRQAFTPTKPRGLQDMNPEEIRIIEARYGVGAKPV